MGEKGRPGNELNPPSIREEQIENCDGSLIISNRWISLQIFLTRLFVSSEFSILGKLLLCKVRLIGKIKEVKEITNFH